MSQRADRESIFETLRAEILDGTLGPGTALREVALAERFGVSRTPVRDALSRLEEAGLLSRIARGLVVKGVDPQTVMQVYDMRILLEEQVSGEAANHRTFNDVLQLEALLERDRSLDTREDITLVRSNLEFHAAIWRAAHNPILSDLLDRLSSHLVHAPSSTLSVGDRWSAALDEHAEMLDAIRERDVVKARETARQHFQEAQRIRLQLLREALAQKAKASLSS